MCDDDAGQMRKVGKFIMEDDNTATISPMNSTTNKKSVSFALQIDEEEELFVFNRTTVGGSNQPVFYQS